MIDLAWQTAKKILCVRLDSMGDVLMTTPAIRAIKDSLPGCEITLLTSSAGAEIARFIPSVDQVLEYGAPWMKSTEIRVDSHKDFGLITRLQQAGFDAAIIFTVFSQNPLAAAFLCYLANIPIRLAYCRENPYQLLTHWLKDTEIESGIRHEVQRQLDLVKAVGFASSRASLELAINTEDQLSAIKKLKEAGGDPAEPWIAIHPGASAPSRRYPFEGFADAARILADEDRLQIVFTGSPEEADLIQNIRDRMGKSPSISLAGQLYTGELCGLISSAGMILTNNTGPAHIAAAVGCPVVDLYALTNPQHTPWGVNSIVLFHDVPCKYCYKSICPLGHHHCLSMVSAGQIVEAVRRLRREAAEGHAFIERV